MADDQKATSSKTSAQISDEGKMILVTKEGLKKLKEELENLQNVARKEVAERIKEAISYGDLSENSEYEEAKNYQAWVEGRIAELENKIKYAKLIEEKHRVATVQLGTTVVVKDLSSKKAEPLEYTIVGSTESNPFLKKISNESPVGRALLERKVGDKIKIQVPSGTVEYEILKLE